jgi:hypothetical protein
LLHNYSFRERPSGRAVERLNEILAAVVECDVTQVFAVPVPPPQGYEFRIGRFGVGPLNAQRLAYWCERAGSDYFERYKDRLRGGLSVERDVFQAKVVDWKRFVPELNRTLSHVGPAVRSSRPILENYFQSVASELFMGFWEGLREDQVLTLAVGASLFSAEKLRVLPFAQSITILLRAASPRWGYVAPTSVGVTIELAGTNTRIPEAEQTLRQYGVPAAGESELHASLSSFARFMGRAREHWWEGRREEGFLHFVIALDLLLGERGSSTDAVAGRSAVLVHRALGRSLDEQFRLLTKAYDKRSRYVHQGQQVEESDVESIDAVCHEVLFCLLRMYRDGRSSETEIIRRWHRDLDYLRSAIEARRVPPDAELSHNGILV